MSIFKRLHRRSTLFVAFVSVMTLPAAALADMPSEVLQKYVERPDDSYGWAIRYKTNVGSCKLTELTLTSQTWRGIVWQHRLFVMVPDGVAKETAAMLVVAGGSWKDEYARPIVGEDSRLPKTALLMAAYVQQMGCPIAVLLNVPRQPLFDGKREDEIIAMTFDRYLTTGESDWPLLLPMVKSAVRAMDAVQEFGVRNLDLKIDRFTVTGASKRGWTTWLLSAVDRRVSGLAPMVIDTLNMPAQLKHQLAAYGRFSERIHDYTDFDLPRRMQDKLGGALCQIVDPYSYRKRITQPKMLFLGTNDGYWTVDSLNLYWDGLEGDKYVVYVPNADHDLANDWARVFGGLQALYRHVNGTEALPSLKWEFANATDDGRLRLKADSGNDAAQVTLWTADSPTRDFRKAAWSGKLLSMGRKNAVEVSRPGSGYRAVYADALYTHGKMPFHLSTTMRVLDAAEE